MRRLFPNTKIDDLSQYNAFLELEFIKCQKQPELKELNIWKSKISEKYRQAKNTNIESRKTLISLLKTELENAKTKYQEKSKNKRAVFFERKNYKMVTKYEF
jgi:hypothetical protein